MNYRASEYLVPIFDFDVLHLQLNTPIYIFVLVLIVMFFMNKLLFRPVLQTLDSRQTYLEGLQESAAEQQREIVLLTEQYEAKLEAARTEVARGRDDTRREAEKVTKAILYGARQEADAEMRQAVAELRDEVESARQTLAESAHALAEQTTKRILN